MWTATTSSRNSSSGGKISDEGRRCRRSTELLDAAVTDVSSDRERELLRRVRRRKGWRGKWLSLAGAAAAVLVLLTLFHSLREKFLFPNRFAQQQAEVTEQRSDAIERDLTLAREAAGSVQRELSRKPSEPVDARREGNSAPSSQPPILEGTKTTAGREPADTPSAFGSSDEQKLLSRADTFLRIGDLSGARLVLERAVQAGSALAAFKLAETYDPKQLPRWRAQGLRGDWERAQALYERARSGGVTEAQQRLEAAR
jgi:hypothetical protein